MNLSTTTPQPAGQSSTENIVSAVETLFASDQVSSVEVSSTVNTPATLAHTTSTDGLITIDLKQLNALIKDAVSKIVADAVVDVRKGQAQGHAVIMDKLSELNNTVLGLKNSVIATNQAVAGLKTSNGLKKPAVVYVGKAEEPNDLFNGDK
jgi:hypothetical protein